MGQEEAAPLPVTVVVVASWEQAVKHAVEDRDLSPPPESPKKPKAPTRRLSVPPPPGRPPSSMPGPKSSFSRGRAVRPEDDPFLAAYLACTTNSATGGGGKRNGRGAAARPEPNNKGLRRLTWAGLGLSCKGSSAAVEQSMVKLAKRPEMDPRDA